MSEQLDKNTNQTDERLTKESLQLQKVLWIREEVNKKRAQEDQLLDQIFREQQLLQEMDDDMDVNMEHAKEGRKYRADIRERVEDRVYEMHDLSADKREGMREYKQAYRRGYALAMFFLSLTLCVFAGYLHGITSQICLVLLMFTGTQAALLVHEKECFVFWRVLCTFLGSIIFPGMLVLFIGYELHLDYYKFALPYSLAGAFVVLAITTAAYFLYDPYRAARRRISDAKSMIKTVEKSARKQVKKNQKMLAKQDVKQQRLLKKQEVKAQKQQQKQESREQKAQEKQENRAQKLQQKEELLLEQKEKAQGWFDKLRQKVKKPKQAEDDAVVEEKEQAESPQPEVQTEVNAEGSSTEPAKDATYNEAKTTEAEADNSEEEKSETVEDTASEDNCKETES